MLFSTSKFVILLSSLQQTNQAVHLIQQTASFHQSHRDQVMNQLADELISYC